MPEQSSLPRTADAPVEHDAVAHAPRPVQALVLLLLGGLIAAWFLLVQRFDGGDVYGALGPFALLVLACCAGVRGRALRRWLRPDRRAVVVGLAVGAGMTALTYPVYEALVWAFPALEHVVADLYSGARSTSLPRALGWVVAILVAEELLFRGVWPAALGRFLSQRKAYALSLLTYVGAQLGTGSAIVALMALVCGAIWTVQRVQMDSLLSPLIAHAIWTPTVILLHPVT